MAVADEPELATQAAEDDGRGGEAVFGMLRQAGVHRLLVVFADVGGDATEKLFAGGILRHLADIAADEQHGIAPVGVEQAVPVVGLRRAAVDDGNEVIGYDDAVLAFLSGILGDEGLFEDLHGTGGYYGTSGASGASGRDGNCRLGVGVP